MTKNWFTWLYVLVCFAFLFSVLISVKVFKTTYLFNITKSYPRGLWKMPKAEFVPTQSKGLFVMFCGDNSDFFKLAKERKYLGKGEHCENGLHPLLKKVVAVQSDTVTLNEQGVWVNQVKIKNSKPQKTDSKGRAMPKLQDLNNWVLPDDRVWVMSDYSPKSLDSRYYGAIHASQIKGVVEPVLVFDSF